MRALKEVQNGFYIDIGAHHPVIDSVSFAFYLDGWRGIHVEPNHAFASLLREYRPDEQIIEAACTAATEQISFFVIGDTGLSTGVREHALKHLSSGYEITETRVQVTSLDQILALSHGKDVHWLKIDVEGMEADVLESWGDCRVRPWICIIESTLPNSPEENNQLWEKYLTAKEYSCVYFDGLNRYFLHKSKVHLAIHFGPGPNVFDHFSLSETSPFVREVAEAQQASLRAQIERGKTELATLASQNAQRELRQKSFAEAQKRTLSKILQELQIELAHLKVQLADAHASKEETARRALQLEEQVRIQDEQTASFLRRAHEAELRGADLENEINSLKNQLNDAQQTMTNSSEQIHHMAHQMQIKEQEANSLFTRMKEIELRSKLQEEEIQSLKSQLLDTIARLSSAREVAVKADKEIIELKASILTQRAEPSLPSIFTTRIANSLVALFRGVKSGVEFLQSAARKGELTTDTPLAALSTPRSVLDPLKVAVIAPVSPSGISGGAERFYRGLARAVEQIGCKVDLIQEVFDESSFESIQAGYRNFEAMDLSVYDLVISTKAPSFCITHPNHVLYLVHTIRVFYDMFDQTFSKPDPTLLDCRAWIQAKDTEAISRIERRFTIGKEVSERLLHYNGIHAEVLHPALELTNPRVTPIGDYIFLPGRLHRWKRVYLAIAAVKQSKLPIKLRIAGSGEDEQELRELSEGDDRIVFEGHVTDERLKELYEGALSVVFCPVREDYGYVTLEAFAHGKPVITCTDSGETLQFVIDGVTGLVVNPEVDDLQIALERLWFDRHAAKEMGARGAKIVDGLRWDSIASKLVRPPGRVAASLLMNSNQERIRVAVLDMQPITPPIGGGRLRLLGLYHDLGDDFDVRYVGAYDWRGESIRRKFINPTLKETVLPLTEEHYAAADAAKAKASNKVVIDQLFADQAHLSPHFVAEAIETSKWADVVVFSHPWVFPLVPSSVLDKKLVVYDAQNMEYDLRRSLLDQSNPFEATVIDRVEAAERELGARANLVLACSPEDAERFEQHYGWDPSSIEQVPNGTFISEFQPFDPLVKASARGRLGIKDNEVIALFIGSDYGPNIEAAAEILNRLSPGCPEITFVIAGGVCSSLPDKVPRNIRATGYLTDEQRRDWLLAADVALNPMLSGSGTNIKMLEFGAASLPIVSTRIGARGIVHASSFGITICSVEEMTDEIRRLASSTELRASEGAEARHLVETRFSWEQLSRNLGTTLISDFSKFKSLDAGLRLDNRARVVHFCTVGQKCGIGEYSAHFMKALEAKEVTNIVFTCRTPTLVPNTSAFPEKSGIAWFHDNVRYQATTLSEDIEALVKYASADYAIVQHHPAFLPSHELLRLVAMFKSSKTRVAVVLHSQDPGNKELIRDLNAESVPVYSHKRRDIAEAQRSGLDLRHIPLPVPDFNFGGKERAHRNLLAPEIVMNGFLRAHKGVDQLVRAFSIVLRQLPDARLTLLCPLYPSEDSVAALEQINELIEQHGIGGSVTLDTDYKGIDEVLCRLSQATLAVYPYAKSSEGGSAAASDAIAVGLPVIVSESRIFDDIRHVALTSSTEPVELAGSILELLGSVSLIQSYAKRSRSYAARNSWQNVIQVIFAGLQ